MNACIWHNTSTLQIIGVISKPNCRLIAKPSFKTELHGY